MLIFFVLVGGFRKINPSACLRATYLRGCLIHRLNFQRILTYYIFLFSRETFHFLTASLSLYLFIYLCLSIRLSSHKDAFILNHDRRGSLPSTVSVSFFVGPFLRGSSLSLARRRVKHRVTDCKYVVREAAKTRKRGLEVCRG